MPASTFSQRNGLQPLPPQLQLKQLSKELRVLIHYVIHLSMEDSVTSGYESSWLIDPWHRIMRDLHVRVAHATVTSFDTNATKNKRLVENIILNAPYNQLFDFLEFVLQHPAVPSNVRQELAQAFIDGRAAYRVLDGGLIGAVGTGEQGEAVSQALELTAEVAPSTSSHLSSAAHELSNGRWAASVRESIHAVESIAVQLAPSKSTLADALAVLERQGRIHGSLKAAFSKLYGYTSDEEGVRHALVFQDESIVDEADALFMLGACASFVTYLVTRGRAAGLAEEHQ